MQDFQEVDLRIANLIKHHSIRERCFLICGTNGRADLCLRLLYELHFRLCKTLEIFD